MSVHVQAVGVSKRFRGSGFVFQRASFELHSGTITFLSGANGTGKSTLLRVLGGITRATSGRVLTSAPGCAIVPERFVPPNNMTPMSYLLHMGRLRGQRTSSIEARCHFLLELLGVAGARKVIMNELSKGTAQKVAIAQAFLLPCPLIILDEPHTGLDSHASQALDFLTAQARVLRSAIIITEHDQGRVPSADQVLTLHAGTVVVAPAETATVAERRVLVRLIRTASTRGTGGALVRPLQVSVVSTLGAELRLDVRRSAVNQLLRQALDSEWQIQEVQEQP